VPESVRRAPRTVVGSLDGLRRLADATGSTVVRARHSGAYLLPAGDVLYVHDPGASISTADEPTSEPMDEPTDPSAVTAAEGRSPDVDAGSTVDRLRAGVETARRVDALVDSTGEGVSAVAHTADVFAGVDPDGEVEDGEGRSRHVSDAGEVRGVTTAGRADEAGPPAVDASEGDGGGEDGRDDVGPVESGGTERVVTGPDTWTSGGTDDRSDEDRSPLDPFSSPPLTDDEDGDGSGVADD
jgi:hypothetical protein